MLLITQRREPRARWDGELVLPFDLRQKSRLRTALTSRKEVGLFLERAEVLRDGDFLLAERGCVVRVVAKPEHVLDILCKSPEALARAAYHLGSRDVPLQVGADWLRIADDPVLRRMVEGVGSTVVPRDVPFEPEARACSSGHSHDAPATHGGIIDEFGKVSTAGH